MKHKNIKKLLKTPSDMLAEDIAQYAIFNTTDNDNTKFQNIVELIVQYSASINKQAPLSNETKVVESVEQAAQITCRKTIIGCYNLLGIVS